MNQKVQDFLQTVPHVVLNNPEVIAGASTPNPAGKKAKFRKLCAAAGRPTISGHIGDKDHGKQTVQSSNAWRPSRQARREDIPLYEILGDQSPHRRTCFDFRPERPGSPRSHRLRRGRPAPKKWMSTASSDCTNTLQFMPMQGMRTTN